MRKIGSSVAALALTVALLGAMATTAQARTLTVFGEEQGDGHRTKGGFVFHERLFTAEGEHVGRNRIEVTRTGGRGFKAKALFRFEGGKIRVAGPVSRGRVVFLPITGGKGMFFDITGQVRIEFLGDKDLAKYTFNYPR